VGGRESPTAYAEWEHRWGRALVERFLERWGDLRGKKVLDVGCGMGGKTIAYGEAGAREVVGVDLAERHLEVASEFARSRPLRCSWKFLQADVSALPFSEGRFDTVIANDAMEHFREPEAALREMTRVTRPGGVLWIFFTPHYSPLGSHLYDYVTLPWCHLWLTRRQLEGVVVRVLRDRHPDLGEAERAERVEAIFRSYEEDLNGMSVRRSFRLIRRFPELRVSYRRLDPPRWSWLRPLLVLPGLRELLTGTVTCRLEKVADR
jgi:ubiquinone/menaquinone biosynthesis C-methylase UbiE